MNDHSFQITASALDHRSSKTTQIYEILRAAIISMRLPPGASIPEKDICLQFDISRTPVREAILRLMTEDLVVVKPGEGSFVQRVILREVLNGQIVRDTLEMRLVRLTARHFTDVLSTEFDVSLMRQRIAADRRDVDGFFDLDNQFRRLVCNASGFPNAWRTIHDATGQLDRVRLHAFRTENKILEVLDERTRMYECFRANDEDGAASVFQVQIDSTFIAIELIREATPAFFDDDVELVRVGDIR